MIIAQVFCNIATYKSYFKYRINISTCSTRIDASWSCQLLILMAHDVTRRELKMHEPFSHNEVLFYLTLPKRWVFYEWEFSCHKWLPRQGPFHIFERTLIALVFSQAASWAIWSTSQAFCHRVVASSFGDYSRWDAEELRVRAFLFVRTEILSDQRSPFQS